MIRARIAAICASVAALVLVGGVARAADAVYPPSAVEPTTDVQGVKTGVGEVAGGGLADTGFNSTYLVLAIALLLVGVALVLVARRRAH